MDKSLNPKVKYRVVTGRNPRTGEVAYRPVVANRETATTENGFRVAATTLKNAKLSIGDFN